MSHTSSLQADIEAHPRRDDLARLVRTVAFSAADERRVRFGDGLDELSSEAELSPQDGALGEFNVLEALGRAEPPVLTGRTAVALLLAHGMALEPPDDDEAAKRVAERLCWLAANTWIDALWALDDALDDEPAGRVWHALAALARDSDERGTPAGRAEALCALAALSGSQHQAVADEKIALGGALRDPLLSRTMRATASVDDYTVPFAAEERISGELVPAPLGPIALLLWTVSGLIVFRYLFRFIANVVLRCRRPVELIVARGGVRMFAKLDMLGRTLQSREIHIPAAFLARAEREVRYPRLGLYAGLLALAVGTYVGASLVTDGGRAASPSLLALGAGIFGLGVALDLVFANLVPSRRGKYRLLFVPQKGSVVAVATLDERAADRALRVLGRA